MADKFGDAHRLVRLHCPLAPPMLSRYWIQKAYADICDARGWSWLRGEGAFLLNAQKLGTVDVTRGSTSVSGGTMVYATTDVNRQIRFPPGDMYTIIDATAGGYTLDRVFGGTTATGTSAAVLDAYLTVPADFQRFISVLDISNNWQLHLWITEEEINSWDAQRSATGTPWAIVSRKLATAGTLTGRIQYELWPYCVSQKTYPYYYYRRPENLTDDSNFLGPLAQDSNILVTMALAEAARWPGVDGKKNPYFNLGLAQQLDKQASEAADRLQVLDEEVYMTWLQTIDFSRTPFAPVDSRFMQSHDLDLGGVSWPH